MAQISPDDFPAIRKKHMGKKIVHASGMFDLLHPGHMLFLEDCRKHGDILVLGVGGGKNVKRAKNSSRPVMNLAMRMKLVDSLRMVDYCFTSDHAPVHHPLEFLETIFSLLEPDVYVVNEDASDIPYRRKIAEEYKVQFVVLPRCCPPEFKGISTTKLIQKIQDMPRE